MERRIIQITKFYMVRELVGFRNGLYTSTSSLGFCWICKRVLTYYIYTSIQGYIRERIVLNHVGQDFRKTGYYPIVPVASLIGEPDLQLFSDTTVISECSLSRFFYFDSAHIGDNQLYRYYRLYFDTPISIPPFCLNQLKMQNRYAWMCSPNFHGHTQWIF